MEEQTKGKTILQFSNKLNNRLDRFLADHNGSRTAIINIALSDFLGKRGY